MMTNIEKMLINAINNGLNGSSSFLKSNAGDKNKEDTKEKEVEQKEKEDVIEVKEATSFTSEDIHGGNEATGDIENSPNASDNGKEAKDENNSNNKENGKETKEKNNSNNKENNKETKDENNSDDKENESGNNSQTNKASSSESSKNKETNGEGDDIIVKSMSIEETLEALKNKMNVSDKIMDSFREVLKRERSFSKSFGHSKWDINKICNHLITNQEYLIFRDKYSNVPKKASIFIDTSASMYEWIASIQKAIRMLITSGYEVDLYGIGNGFLEESPSLHDDMYHVRDQLKRISTDANIPNICRPNIEDGIKITNSSEIAIIIADFDGLTSIVKMAMGCSKIPYLFSIEDRYSWDDPTEHDWVDPDFCEYPDWNHVFNIVECDDSDYDDDYYYDDDDYYDEK